MRTTAFNTGIGCFLQPDSDIDKARVTEVKSNFVLDPARTIADPGQETPPQLRTHDIQA